MTMVVPEENLCKRCKKREKAPDKSRCQECLDYAAEWQKKRTATAREQGLCITCKAPSEASRCEECSKKKADSYYKNKEGTSPPPLAIAI